MVIENHVRSCHHRLYSVFHLQTVPGSTLVKVVIIYASSYKMYNMTYTLVFLAVEIV